MVINVGYSIVNYSNLKKTMRFDAEYYKAEYLKIEDDLNKLKSSPLSDIIENITNGVEIRDFVESGVPYIKVGNTNKDFFVDFTNISFVRESAANKVSKDIILEEGDILTNRSGTLGYSQIITKDMQKSIISSHNIRIMKIKINPYYLVTFLNTRYGKMQILRRNNGGVVPEINQPALKSVFIYIPDEKYQKIIEEKIKKAYSFLIESQKILKEAQTVLENELEVTKESLERSGTTLINYSDLACENRFDAQFFSSKKFKSHFDNKFKTKSLKELCEKIDTGLTPAKDSYCNKGYPVLKMGCLTNKGIDWSRIEFANESYYKRAKKYLVANKDIILTSSAHSIEHIGKKVDIVFDIPKEYKGELVFVGEVMRLRVKKNTINPFYIALFLRTEIGYRLLQNSIRGQTAHIYPKDIKKILIPLVNAEIQDKIEELLLESHKYLQESNNILIDAVISVERTIESKLKFNSHN